MLTNQHKEVITREVRGQKTEEREVRGQKLM